jgi:hypothetical protein
MFHLESEGQIAPFTCVYAYTTGLAGWLRALSSWLVHFHTPPCLGIETWMLSSRHPGCFLWVKPLEKSGFTIPSTQTAGPGPCVGPLISHIAKSFLGYQMYLYPWVEVTCAVALRTKISLLLWLVSILFPGWWGTDACHFLSGSLDMTCQPGLSPLCSCSVHRMAQSHDSYKKQIKTE